MKKLILTATLTAICALCAGCATTTGDPNNMMQTWTNPASDGRNSALKMLGR